MATLTINATEDYSDSNPPLNNITLIEFNAAGFALATFLASQFDNVQIAQNVSISGDANQNWVLVAAISGTFVASWTVSNWSGSDVLELRGMDGGAETITGPNASGGLVRFNGFGGADRLVGGAATNELFYSNGFQLAAGEELTGGPLTDSIFLLNPDTYDFSVAILSGIENLNFNGQATIATLSGEQIGAGAITNVFGGLLNNVRTLIVNGANVDLSPVVSTTGLPRTLSRSTAREGPIRSQARARTTRSRRPRS